MSVDLEYSAAFDDTKLCKRRGHSVRLVQNDAYLSASSVHHTRDLLTGNTIQVVLADVALRNIDRNEFDEWPDHMMQEQITRLSRTRAPIPPRSGNFCESTPRLYGEYHQLTTSITCNHTQIIFSRSFHLFSGGERGRESRRARRAARPCPFGRLCKAQLMTVRENCSPKPGPPCLGFAWHLLSIRPLIRHFDTHL